MSKPILLHTDDPRLPLFLAAALISLGGTLKLTNRLRDSIPDASAFAITMNDEDEGEIRALDAQDVDFNEFDCGDEFGNGTPCVEVYGLNDESDEGDDDDGDDDEPRQQALEAIERALRKLFNAQP